MTGDARGEADRIREAVESSPESVIGMGIDVADVLALCDLADAARRLDVIDMGEHGVAVVGIDEVRNTLARLDGEASR